MTWSTLTDEFRSQLGIGQTHVEGRNVVDKASGSPFFKMHLMYTLDEQGNRLYTLKVLWIQFLISSTL